MSCSAGKARLRFIYMWAMFSLLFTLIRIAQTCISYLLTNITISNICFLIYLSIYLSWPLRTSVGAQPPVSNRINSLISPSMILPLYSMTKLIHLSFQVAVFCRGYLSSIFFDFLIETFSIFSCENYYYFFIFNFNCDSDFLYSLF